MNNKWSSIGLETMSPVLKRAVTYHCWLMNKAEPFLGQRILEIGVGDGSYTSMISLEVKVVGIDVAQDCVDYCLDHHIHPQAEFLLFDLLKDDLSILKKYQLDSAFCFNVLEHVRDDDLFLKSIWEVLSPGGRLVLIVPAMPAIYGAMDALAGHERRYNKKMMQILTGKTQWTLEQYYYFNSVGVFGWWLTNKLARPQSLADPAVGLGVRIFNCVGVPLSQIVDFLIGHRFGQSLLVVLKK